MAARSESQILEVVRRPGIVRAVDLEANEIPRGRLYRLVRKGLVERRARGIHVAGKHPVTAEHTLAWAPSTGATHTDS